MIQSNSTTSVCVMAAFGPGRPWTGGLFYNSFHNLLSVDERIKLDLVVMDNSGPDEGGLRETLGALAVTTSGLVRRRIFLRDAAKVARARQNAGEVSGHIARLCNTMLDAVPSDADWIMWIEPDVEVPAPAASGTVLSRLIADATPNTAIVGCPIHSRQGRYVMVYRAASIEPWGLNNNLPMLRRGVEDVDCVSMGLTLIRASAVRGFRFSVISNFDGSGGPGHDFSLMRDVRVRGLRVLCDWSIQPRHFDTPERWV